MSPKIVKLPHLRVSHVNAPEPAERPVPREPLIVHPPTLLSVVYHQLTSRTASTAPRDEADALSGLWSNDTESSTLDGLWGSEVPSHGVSSEYNDFDVQFSQTDDLPEYERPSSARGARFRVDRYEPRASLVSQVREALRPPPERPRPEATPKPKAEPWPVRPKTPMERAAEYTQGAASYRKKLLGD